MVMVEPLPWVHPAWRLESLDLAWSKKFQVCGVSRCVGFPGARTKVKPDRGQGWRQLQVRQSLCGDSRVPAWHGRGKAVHHKPRHCSGRG